jgi:hypothetical protein
MVCWGFAHQIQGEQKIATSKLLTIAVSEVLCKAFSALGVAPVTPKKEGED